MNQAIDHLIIIIIIYYETRTKVHEKKTHKENTDHRKHTKRNTKKTHHEKHIKTSLIN